MSGGDPSQPLKAKPNVYIVDREINSTILLIHEDKSADNKEDDAFGQVVAEAIAAFQDAQQKHKRLTNYPLLLGVCHGTQISFMRATIPWSVVETVQKGTVVHGEQLVIQRYWKTDRGWSFQLKEELDQIIACLACWNYIIHHVDVMEYLEDEE